MELNMELNQLDAKVLSYNYHKDKVESELARVLEWIKSRAKLGLISTDQIIMVDKAVTKFVIEKLKVKGFAVSSIPLENVQGVEAFRLIVEWV